MGNPKDKNVNTDEPKNKKASANATNKQPVTEGRTSTTKNNIVTQKITRPQPMLESILLFWVNVDDRGRKMFAEACQTRLQNIKNASWYKETIHKVHCPPIQAIHEIGPIVDKWIEKYGGKDKIKTREIGLFSHASDDGPISYHIKNIPPAPGWPCQMAISDGWDKIDFNWIDTAKCVFYGCNSGRDITNGFAKRISALANFKNVVIWGQSTYSYPSFLPDFRLTTMARNMKTGWDVGATYMVGGNKKEGGKATSPSLSYPPANPLFFFKNGIKLGQSHQGIFNDHG